MELYYKNILEVAEEGLYDEAGDLEAFGDGTTYASGASATVDQANFKFNLTGITLIADLTDANDLFNGYILYFPASGNRYHIIDWVAATDIATVFEVPDTDDTTAFEIRLALYEGQSSASQPVHMAADGWIKRQWVGQQAVAQEILAALPNYCLDGGFEEQAAGNVGGDWVAESTAWQISATSPLIGARMIVWTIGVVDAYFYQNLLGTFKKDKTYIILMKVQSVTASPSAGILNVNLRQKDSPNTNLDASVGTWNPAVTTTAAWVSQEFTPDFTTDEAQFFIDGINANKGSATAIRIDEIYIYEKQNAAQVLLAWHTIFPHTAMTVRGLRCNSKRTSYSQANDSALLGTLTIAGKDVVSTALTVGAYPIYRIAIPAITGKTPKAGLIGLYPTQVFGNLALPHPANYRSPNDYSEADAGIIFTDDRKPLQNVFSGTFRLKTAADFAAFKDFYRWVKEGKRPFWISHDGYVRFVRFQDSPRLERRPNEIRDISATFLEEMDLEF